MALPYPLYLIESRHPHPMYTTGVSKLDGIEIGKAYSCISVVHHEVGTRLNHLETIGVITLQLDGNSFVWMDIEISVL